MHEFLPRTSEQIKRLSKATGVSTEFIAHRSERGEERSGAGEEEGAKKERRTVAGPKITGVTSALNNAVDEAFKGLDLDQLEKDWIKFSK